MTTFDDRLKTLRDQAENAGRAVHDVSKDARSGYEEAFERMEQVLPYAELVLNSTEAPLVSQQASSGIESALLTIKDNIASQPQSAEVWAMQLLDALAVLPVARGQDLANEAKSAAAKFQQSAAQRQNALWTDGNRLKTRLGELEGSIGERANELTQLVDERRAEIDGLVSDVRTAVDEQRGRIQAATTEHAEAFRKAQDDRATEFHGQLDAFTGELGTQTSTAQAKVDEALGKIQKIYNDVVGMSGAIGLQGTARKYEDEFTEQRKAANAWRLVTVGTVFLATLAALLAASADDTDDPRFISRLLISIALGALATYTAKQSARHRRREERARDLQLELSAFSPFIEPLPDEEKVEERVQMTRKTFGGSRRSLDEGQDDDDGGPTLLSQVMIRRKRDQNGAT